MCLLTLLLLYKSFKCNYGQCHTDRNILITIAYSLLIDITTISLLLLIRGGSNVQKFLTMTMAKISKLPRSNGQNWSFLTMTMAKITGCHGQFFEH